MHPETLRNANLDAHNDHRLFMAFTIASMLTNKSKVNGAESVDVSYPQFVSEMRRLGADILPLSELNILGLFESLYNEDFRGHLIRFRI